MATPKTPAPSRADATGAALRTPTDLKGKGVAAVAAAVNGLIADAFALYLKTKNFHWHLTGPNFRDFHLMLDEQAGQIIASIDPLAERVRKLGGTTLRSIGEVGRRQTLSDNDADFVPPLSMLTELMADNNAVAAAMRAAHDVCDEAKDYATASLIEVYLDETERRVWFLFESSRAGDATGH